MKKRKILTLILVLSLLLFPSLNQILIGASNVIATIPADTGPYSLTVNPVMNETYVANLMAGTITVIDSNNNSTNLAVGVFPISIAVNPNTNKVYVADWWYNYLYTIDGTTHAVISSIYLYRQPRAIAVNTNTNKIYVALYGSDKVAVINGNTNNLENTISIGPLPTTPRAIALNPNTNKIYTANYGTDDITVIDGNTLATTRVAAGLDPRAIAIDIDRNKIYVTNYSSHNVTILDGATLNTTLVAVEKNPRGLAIDSINNKVYVANYGSNSLSVIDGATLSTTTIATGAKPTSVEIATNYNKVYVTNYGGNSVTVVDGNTYATTSISVGELPWALSYNANLNRIYVANYKSNNVSVIEDTPGLALAPLKFAFADLSSSKLKVSIKPLPNGITPDETPIFEGTATNHRAPYNCNITNIFFQIDSIRGQWQKATITEGKGTPSVSWEAQLKEALSQGEHTIYIMPLDASAATISSSGDGQSNSPISGNIASYPFEVGEEVKDITPPISLINFVGEKGENGWFVSDVTVELSSADEPGGSGIAQTLYSLDEGLSWENYNQPFVISREGINQIQFYSTDKTGNKENVKTEVFKIDKTPPEIEIVSPQAQEYLHSDYLLISYAVKDEVSGFLSSQALLDQEEVSNGEIIELASLPLGLHQFSLWAKDKAGNIGEKKVSFKVIANFTSLSSLTKRFVSAPGIQNSLIVKVYTAQAAKEKGNLKITQNILNAYLNEVKAQTGKVIAEREAATLTQDTLYIIY